MASGPLPTVRPDHTGGVRVPRWASPWWTALVLLAVAEAAALGVRVLRVPPRHDWEAAAQAVRDRLEDGDAVLAVPRWADPLLREQLGDRMSLALSGRSDLSAFDRLWVFSIRGARSPEAPPREPDLIEQHGRVRVARYDFAPSTVVLDLVEALPTASVALTERGQTRPCHWRARRAAPVRGGLGFGPAPAAQRFVCDPRRSWLWVGATVTEDLALRPRRCVWQHPAGREPVSVTYKDVHLGSHLVLYGGLYHRHERDRAGGPVHVRVLVDGREVGRAVHRDGEGFKRMEFATRPPDGAPRGDLRIEVTAPDPTRRSFCWSGSLRDGRRREGS